jgi:uncharacterized protein YjcR
MPRARDPNRNKAFQIYMDAGGKIDLVEIASQLNISAGTVRGWKSKDKWEEQLNGTLQTKVTERSKRAKGGQPGNQNAKGSKGGSGAAPQRNKNAEKHGAYSKVYWDALDEDELDLIDSMDSAEEQQLVMQLQMFSVRERRLMRRIKKYRELEAENHGLAVKAVSKTKKIEDLTDFEGESVGAGKYKKVTETSVTGTEPVMNSIMTLEAELTKVQRAKTKAIEALAKLHLEKQKLEGDTSTNDIVKSWVEKVTRERGNSNAE